MAKIHKKKYVRFKWWQYRSWFAMIIILTFCLGGMAGYFTRDFLDELSRLSNTVIVPESNVDLDIGVPQPVPEQGKEQVKDY